jgi:hypothetical protein
MGKPSDFAVKGTDEQERTQLYDVQIFNGKSLLGVVTVTAKSPEDASNVAIKDINVKIKKNWN